MLDLVRGQCVGLGKGCVLDLIMGQRVGVGKGSVCWTW